MSAPPDRFIESGVVQVMAIENGRNQATPPKPATDRYAGGIAGLSADRDWPMELPSEGHEVWCLTPSSVATAGSGSRTRPSGSVGSAGSSKPPVPILPGDAPPSAP